MQIITLGKKLLVKFQQWHIGENFTLKKNTRYLKAHVLQTADNR